MSNKLKTDKNSNTIKILIPVAVVILCIAAIIFFFTINNTDADLTDAEAKAVTGSVSDADNNTGDAAEGESNKGDVQVISEGESLIIPISDISSTVSFYPVEVDGTQMEVLAVADSEGNIRTAFNTCQICYSSGHGYYVQDGSYLVCQNCGNRFTVDQIEIQTGGCNPWPIFEENKTVTDDAIEISYDFLYESKTIFANWKTMY